MISTRERSAVEEARDVAPAPVPAAAPVDTKAWLGSRIPGEVALMMGVVWYVLFLIGTAVEPSTENALPVIDAVLGWVMLGAIAATAVGLGARRRWGLVASTGGAGLFTAMVVACPTTGHHALAAWWFVQFACAAALLGASVYALRRV